jgi:hypothetical protein
VPDSRIAVGGHSYGAFMATNLLAHSRLFEAGIGRSGAYNRLLTPFGFQSEERTLWEAPQVLSVCRPCASPSRVLFCVGVGVRAPVVSVERYLSLS